MNTHPANPNTTSSTIRKLVLLLTIALLPLVAKAQPAVGSLTNPSICGGTDGAIRITGLLLNQPYIVYYNKNGVGLPGAFILTTDASGNLDIVTWGTFTMTAGTYSDIQVSDGVVTSFFPGPYVLTNPPATINPVSNQALCANATTSAVNFTGTGTTFNWTNNNTSIGLAASGSGNIAPFAVTNATTAPVTATITVTPSNGSICIGTPTNFTITVNPAPTVNAVSNHAVCNGSPTAAIAFTGALSSTTYNWTNDNTSIGLAASGTGDIASFTATNTGTAPVTSTITVTPTKGGCTGTAQVFTITVNPRPTVNTVSDQTLCNGANTTAVNFTGAVSGTVYNWTNDNTSIGLAASGTGNIAAFATINTSTAPVTATIIAIPSANTCTGTAEIFTITVDPTPDVVAVSNQTVCNNGTTTAVSFSGAVTGTTYNWTNNTTSIGLAGSGSGDIAAFTASNAGTAPVTATVTVTPVANGCPGAPGNFTITVNPRATVNTVSNQTLCNAAATTAVNFGGPVSGTTYSWTNNTTSIGLAANGNGNIAAFTATNSGTAPVTATVTVTPTANGCVGTSNNFTITVNPAPTVNTVAGRTVCNGATTTAINFGGPVSGTSYSWTNNTTSIGLAASGNGNIAAFTAQNTGNTPVTAAINVTPSANGCTGASGSFDITVNPTPTLINPGPHAACNGTPINVNLAGPVAGTSFDWVNTNTSIGLAASGTGSIAAFTAINNGTAPEVAILDVTPSANGCTGPVASFTITVKPIPALTSTLTPADICDNTVFNYIPASATSGTLFSWNRQAVTGISNPASLGTNNPAETLHNTTPDPIVVMYRYFLYADGCGNTEYVAVVVKPTPRLNSALSHTLCSDQAFNYTPTSATAGTSFAWTRPNVIGIAPANATGNGAINETLVNSNSAATDVPYVYFLSANGCSNTETVTLTLHNRPHAPVISIKAPESVCANTMYQNFGAATTAPAGTFYTWTAGNAVVWSQSDNHQNALVNFPNAGTSTVTLTTTLSATGCDTSTTVTIQTGTNKAQQPEVIYYNGRFVCLQNDMDVYIWGYDDKESLDSTIVPKETNQDYLNLNPDFNNRLYWVMTMKNGCAQKSYYNAPTSVDRPVAIRTEMRVYPNPATETVYFELGGVHGAEVAFSVYDVAGKLIQTVPGTAGKAQANVSALAQGMYSVFCTVDGAKVAVAKFVKH